MKYLYFIVIFLSYFPITQAQIGITFDEYKKTHNTTFQLDSLYPGGIHSNPEKSVFKLINT